MAVDPQERCEVEVGTLPVIEGCPADSELFFLHNVAGGAGEEGYAWRSYVDLKNCLRDPYIPKFHQFLTTGEELQVVLVPPDDYKVEDDSVFITLEGTELAREPIDPALLKITYTVTYNTSNGQAIIDFFNAASPLPGNQICIIHYGLHKK